MHWKPKSNWRVVPCLLLQAVDLLTSTGYNTLSVMCLFNGPTASALLLRFTVHYGRPVKETPRLLRFTVHYCRPVKETPRLLHFTVHYGRPVKKTPRLHTDHAQNQRYNCELQRGDTRRVFGLMNATWPTGREAMD